MITAILLFAAIFASSNNKRLTLTTELAPARKRSRYEPEAPADVAPLAKRSRNEFSSRIVRMENLVVWMIIERNQALNNLQSFIDFLQLVDPRTDWYTAYQFLISYYVNNQRLPKVLNRDVDDLTYVMLYNDFYSCDSALTFLAKNHALTFEVLIRLVQDESLCSFIQSKLMERPTETHHSNNSVVLLHKAGVAVCTADVISKLVQERSLVLARKYSFHSHLIRECGDFMNDIEKERLWDGVGQALMHQSEKQVTSFNNEDDLNFVMQSMANKLLKLNLTAIFQFMQGKNDMLAYFLFHTKNVHQFIQDKIQKYKDNIVSSH